MCCLLVRLLKQLAAAEEHWGFIAQRLAAEETAFELQERRRPSLSPSLSGLSTAAAYGGSGLSPAVSLSPSTSEKFIQYPSLLLQLSPLQEAAALAAALRTEAKGRVFQEGFLFSSVSPKQFAAFLQGFTPSRLVLVVRTHSYPNS